MAPASRSVALAALFLLATALVTAQTALGRRHRPHPPKGPSSPSSSECVFLEWDRNPNLTSYEFQLQPHRGLVWDFERAAAAVEVIMRRLTAESRDAQGGDKGRSANNKASDGVGPLGKRRWPVEPANFTLVEGSRWDTVLREHAFAVSSRRGAPLHPSRFSSDEDEEEDEEEEQDEDEDDDYAAANNGTRVGRKKKWPFPWRRLAYLRLRRYIVTVPPGSPGAPPPGTADLALKMKKIDPSLGALQPDASLFAPGVRAKLEADVHCDHARVSVSPLFAPVPGDLNVSTVGGVAAYFPGLARLAGVSPDEPLPFCHAVWRRKATWAVVYRGLVGEVGLVAKYNTTLSDAAAGRRAKNGEVSLRIRREVAAGRAGPGGGQEALKGLEEALDALAVATDKFRLDGWDGKTPGTDGKLPPRRGRGRWGGAAAARLLRQAEAEGFVADEHEARDEEVVCERGGSGRRRSGGKGGRRGSSGSDRSSDKAPLPKERRAAAAKEAAAVSKAVV